MEKNSWRMLIHIAAGAYLIFLAYRIFQSVQTGQSSDRVYLIPCVIFLVGGIAFIIEGAYHLYKLSKEPSYTDSYQEPAAKEEPADFDYTAENALTEESSAPALKEDDTSSDLS